MVPTGSRRSRVGTATSVLVVVMLMAAVVYMVEVSHLRASAGHSISGKPVNELWSNLKRVARGGDTTSGASKISPPDIDINVPTNCTTGVAVTDLVAIDLAYVINVPQRTEVFANLEAAGIRAERFPATLISELPSIYLEVDANDTEIVQNAKHESFLAALAEKGIVGNESAHERTLTRGEVAARISHERALDRFLQLAGFYAPGTIELPDHNATAKGDAGKSATAAPAAGKNNTTHSNSTVATKSSSNGSGHNEGDGENLVQDHSKQKPMPKPRTVMVFEDDLAPATVPNGSGVIRDMMAHLPADWDVFFMTRCWDLCLRDEVVWDPQNATDACKFDNSGGSDTEIAKDAINGGSAVNTSDDGEKHRTSARTPTEPPPVVLPTVVRCYRPLCTSAFVTNVRGAAKIRGVDTVDKVQVPANTSTSSAEQAGPTAVSTSGTAKTLLQNTDEDASQQQRPFDVVAHVKRGRNGPYVKSFDNLVGNMILREELIAYCATNPMLFEQDRGNIESILHPKKNAKRPPECTYSHQRQPPSLLEMVMDEY